MATYECAKCGMAVNAFCAKCETALENDFVTSDEGKKYKYQSVQTAMER